MCKDVKHLIVMLLVYLAGPRIKKERCNNNYNKFGLDNVGGGCLWEDPDYDRNTRWERT